MKWPSRRTIALAAAIAAAAALTAGALIAGSAQQNLSFGGAPAASHSPVKHDAAPRGRADEGGINP